MNAPTPFDAGPLSWVRVEIDRTLARAGQALPQAHAGDPEPFIACRSALRQVRGALSLLGLDGAGQFALALEALLDALAQQARPADEAAIDLVQRALAALRDYVDDLADGAPDQPLRLLALYRAVQAARGEARPAASDLFFPDPGVEAPTPPLANDEVQRLLRHDRSRFQRGMLAWLRDPQDSQGAGEMLGAVRSIEATLDSATERALWWVTGAFLCALGAGELSAEADAKPLCARIDQQIRRRLEGSTQHADRLLRDTLYLLANADSREPAVAQVLAAYRLPAAIAGADRVDDSAQDAQKALLRRLREAIAASEAQWNKFCSGSAQALPQFAESAGALSAAAGQLGHTDYRRLAQAIASAARWLAEQPDRHSESLAMEIATAILLAQNAQENFRSLGGDFAHQVDVTVARIHGCIAGNPPLPGSEVPALDAMSRQVQEKRLLAQVAREIQTNLAQIEQVLDTFFRDTTQRAELAGLEGTLHQAIGALSMIGHDAAADALGECAAEIRDFAAAQYVAQDADFERIAERLALVGFFIDGVQYGAGDFASFVRSMPPAAARRSVEPPAAPEVVPEPVAEVIPETVPELVPEAASAAPPGVVPEVVPQVASEAASEVVAEVLPELIPEALAPPAVPVAGSDAAVPIDAELLAIFLEEAHDVLATIDEQLQALGTQPQDAERLTTLRRAFHTLKGSGRMVGLKDLGDAAWSVEQVLNRWLEQSLDVSARFSALLGQAHALFSAWVTFLENPGTARPDPQPLLALAAALASGDELPELLPELLAETELAESASEAPVPQPSAQVIELRPPSGAPAPVDSATPRISVSPTLREIFIEEANEHLATLTGEFCWLENDASAATPPAIARAAHTLAGSAATIGLGGISRCALALENALLRRDQASQPTSREALEVIRQSIAEIETMLDAVAAGGDPEAATGLLDALAQIYPAAAPEEAAPLAEPPAAPALPDEIDAQLLPVFLEEAIDLNASVAAQLRAWRADPADDEIARRLARLLHTMKGSARMVGALRLGEITHAIETRVVVAQGAGKAPPELIDEIDSAYDAVLEGIEQLQRSAAALAAPPAEAAPAADAGFPAVDQRQSPRAPADAENEGEGKVDSGAQRTLLRVRADLVDRLVNETGELSIARARIENEMRAMKDSLLDLSENVVRLRRQLREVEIQAESKIQSRTQLADAPDDAFDPLEIDRFTHFQELTRMMAESVNDVATVQQSLLGNVEQANAALAVQARLNRQVQQELMNIRTVPFDSVADRLHRIVRQTGKELNRRAQLEIHGGQVEIDRGVLDKLGAPLEHLLRNAIAHGLEDRDTRLARGKPETGAISLTLTREGNEIVLAFADDGAGLDLERIRARSVAAGLLGADEAADEARLTELIFAPGVSTASGLSQVSGRGIGMDVVKTEVARLGGRIEVATAAGKGTTFSLYIPLTLAVTQALLVRAGSATYAIPSLMIEQVLDLKEPALAALRDAGAAEWMNQRYPFSYLPQLLGDAQALPETRRKYWVLLLRSGKQRIAVQVDELQGKQEVVVKNIGEQLARVVGIDGAAVLGSGQVVLILNPVALSGRAPAPGLPAASPASAPAAPPPAVMVVDDSLTVRKVTSRLLAREGYEVLTAKDGVDALEQLLDVLPDVLLVDVEMPRMDGFDFTRNVRADPRLKDLPIIMITSRTADKHRQHALEIGVNDYLGKPYHEDELLRLVTGYVKQRRDV